MDYIRFIKFFVPATLFFITIDIIFIGYLFNSQYLKYLKPIARLKSDGTLGPNLFAGILVWMIIVLGMLVFVFPKIAVSSGFESFLWGCLYGFILYGMYDLTNFSVLANWPLTISIFDIVWGTLANGLLAYFLFFLNKYF